MVDLADNSGCSCGSLHRASDMAPSVLSALFWLSVRDALAVAARADSGHQNARPFRRGVRCAIVWGIPVRASRPSRAEARPFSTSVRNHSSWSIELANRSSATGSTVRPSP